MTQPQKLADRIVELLQHVAPSERAEVLKLVCEDLGIELQPVEASTFSVGGDDAG